MVLRVNRFTIDPSSPVPLYYQIRENLRELIKSRELPLDEPIPSERELSEMYGVNRLTVRQAISELVDEGLLRRQRGVGTFVSQEKMIQAMPDLTGFSERMVRAGRVPTSKLFSIGIQPPTRSAAHALKISLETPTVKIVRLRLADSEPIMLETSFLVAAMFPGLENEDLENNSLYRILGARYSVLPVEADEVLEPVILTSYEADILDSEPGRPALLVEGTIYTTARQPIEFGKSLVRGDKARFYFRLHRTGNGASLG